MLCATEVLEEKDISHLNKEVNTVSGWVPITHICKTVPLPMWVVETCDFKLECAEDHRISLSCGTLVHAKEIFPGELITTEKGSQTVTVSRSLGKKENLYDIRVESEDHLYYAEGILGHNSTAIAARSLMKCNLLPDEHCLYIAPRPNQVKTYADRLRQMERGSVYDPANFPTGGNYKNNLYSKEYPNASSMRLEHVLTNADKIRGMSITEALFDEAQDVEPSLMEEILQTLKDAEFPTELYTGTSKTNDTLLETNFQESSRGVYYVRSGSDKRGERWVSLNNPDHLDKMIKIDGLTCPYTGKLLNPMNGKFVHDNKLLESMGILSFHAPQLIVPAYATGDKWIEIYKDFVKYPRNKFLQEVMGIPVEEGHREITKADLKLMCMDISEQRMKDEMAKDLRRYRYVVSGCDWGGSDHNPAAKTKLSYTVHVMLGITHEGDFEIFHMRQYAGGAYDQIINDITRDHVKYSGYAIGSDFGGGQYYNTHLRSSGKVPWERHFIFNYGAPNSLMKPVVEGMANQICLNRTDSISSLFGEIKREKGEARIPRVRCYAWEESHKLLEDFLNMYRAITKSDSGSSSMRYIRHGARSDDTLHAVNYAVIVAKMILGEPMFEDPSILQSIREVMGISTSAQATESLQAAVFGYDITNGYEADAGDGQYF